MIQSECKICERTSHYCSDIGVCPKCEPNFIADKLTIELRKCEVNVHLKTLKGGYADVVIVGEEVYDLLIPEIQERLVKLFGDKLVKKPKMYNPFIRYIWFGDNEHFCDSDEEYYGLPRITQEIIVDKEIDDQERTIQLKREYLVDDFDNKIIETLLTE